MSVDVAGIMEGSGGLAIPVFVPQGAGTVDVLERIAVAVEALGAKTKTAGEKSEKAHDGVAEKIKKLAEWYTYVTGAVSDFARRVTEAAEHVAESSSEADRLARSQARLHVSFAEAAAGAGGFVSELEAMNATQQLAARDLQLTQREVNALARVAQDYARGSGRDFREVVEQLSEGVAKGGEELGKFGGALGRLSQGSHTTEERLRALVTQAEGITPAARTASERIEAFRESLHNADRTFSQSFVEGLARFEQIAERAQRGASATTDWGEKLRALGETAAFVTSWIVSSFNLAFEAVRFTAREIGAEVSMLGSMIAHPTQAGALRTEHERGRAGRRADLDEAFRTHAAITLDIAGDRRSAEPTAPAADMTFTEADVAAGERDQRARRQRTGSSSGGDDHAKSAKAAQMAADQAERELQERQRRAGDEYLQRIIASETERARLSRESATAYAEQVTHADELARISARIAGLSNESTAANETRLTRARSAQGRAESRIGQRAELEDLRDPAVQRERAEDARLAREVSREQRAQQQRLDHLQTFTERWRDLHERQVDITEESAGTLSGAFTSMGNAFAKHAEAFAKGEETIGQALKGMLADALESIGKEAMIKSGFFFAEGLGKLVMYDFPGAGTAFAASAAYAVVGAGALAGSSAIAPDASAKGGTAGASAGGGGSARKSGADRPLPSASNDNGGGGTTVIYQYFAPVIGGRSATDAEVGSHVGRYTDATARRQVRVRPAA